MTISIQQLTFHCRWLSEARLPNYLGSTLRGAFGWALKRSSCMLKHQQCPTCILNKTCAYARLFATEQYEKKQQVQTTNVRPHPLIFQTTMHDRNRGQEGNDWSFSLLVIGPHSEWIPAIILSVRMMGECGIGAGAKHGLGRFALKRVTSGATTVYDTAIDQINIEAQAQNLSLETFTSTDTRQVLVHLQTPLRLKQSNTLQRELPFHTLVRGILRRIAALETAYGQGEPALDYRGLVHRAKEIRSAQSVLRWREIRRYSNRQLQETSLSGLMGTAYYTGELAVFVPLLQYASQVHVGKQTFFGLGKIKIQLDAHTKITTNLSN